MTLKECWSSKGKLHCQSKRKYLQGLLGRFPEQLSRVEQWQHRRQVQTSRLIRPWGARLETCRDFGSWLDSNVDCRTNTFFWCITKGVKLVRGPFGFEASPTSDFDVGDLRELIEPVLPRWANGFGDDFVPINFKLPDFLNDDFWANKKRWDESERIKHRCRNLSEFSLCPAILYWFVVEVDVDFALDPLFDISKLAGVGEAIIGNWVWHSEDPADVVDDVVSNFVKLNCLGEQVLVKVLADKWWVRVKLLDHHATVIKQNDKLFCKFKSRFFFRPRVGHVVHVASISDWLKCFIKSCSVEIAIELNNLLWSVGQWQIAEQDDQLLILFPVEVESMITSVCWVKDDFEKHFTDVW